MQLQKVDPQQPTSGILQGLLFNAPEPIPMSWVIRGLGDRSFGIILLLLGLLAALPGASVVAGGVIAVPAAQMLLARRGPVFPPFLAKKTIRKEHLNSLLKRAIPSLRYVERYIRPRWQAPFEATKRVVGGAILLMGGLLFAPIPFSNVPPALVIVLLAFAYLEKDGILLCIALCLALALLSIAFGIVWQTARLF